jgi:hypothetical protein
MEEFHMLSGFHEKEIDRLRLKFLATTDGAETMSKDMFMNIEGICENPLIDRICVCMGFSDEAPSLSFEKFLCGVAAFNSPVLKEVSKNKISYLCNAICRDLIGCKATQFTVISCNLM